MVSSGERTRRDGNWWLGQTEFFKTSYVLGMFDGVQLGRYFIVRAVKSSADTEKISALSLSTENEQLLMSNVTVGQVQAGLDDFYQDYKNRKTESIDAVEVVLEGAAGMPKDQLEKFVLNLEAVRL